jgi:hypothetical protein
LVDFMEKNTTINAVSNCATMEILWAAINWQRPGLLTAGVLLMHNNTWPLVATLTQRTLQHFRWTVLKHAPYSPHLVLSDFHLFPTLRIIFLATNLWVMMTWKQFLWGGWNLRTQNYTRQELTNLAHEWTDASILMGTLLNGKVVSVDNTCYLFVQNVSIYIRLCVVNLFLTAPLMYIFVGKWPV